MRQAPAYIIISLIFFILIGMGFAYSYFFYPNYHPIDCLFKSYTGRACPTCGFSRSFSYFTHAQWEQAIQFNSHALPVFLFFTYQFILRMGIVFFYFTARKIISTSFIKMDMIISISLFLLAFLPLILNLHEYGNSR